MRQWAAVVCGLAISIGCGAGLSVEEDESVDETGGDETGVVDEWVSGQPGLAPIGPAAYGNGESPDAGNSDGGIVEDCDQSDEDSDAHTDEHGKHDR